MNYQGSTSMTVLLFVRGEFLTLYGRTSSGGERTLSAADLFKETTYGKKEEDRFCKKGRLKGCAMAHLGSRGVRHERVKS